MIDEKTKRPYTIYNLSKAFNEIRDAAGLPAEYQARDMRRAGMDETGEAGATDDELRSRSGHKDRNVVHVYVKPNRRKAANALAKRRANLANRGCDFGGGDQISARGGAEIYLDSLRKSLIYTMATKRERVQVI